MSKVDQTVAETEFARLCKLRRVNLDKMTDDENKSFVEIRDTLVQLIVEGRMAVDEKGGVTLTVYTDGAAETIVFKRLTARALMTGPRADGKPKDDVERQNSALAELTGRSPGFISNMDFADWTVCGLVLKLFLASKS